MDVNFSQVVIESPDFIIQIYFENSSINLTEDIVELLNEAKYKGKPIGGTYSAIEHKPKVPPNAQPHYHFYDRNNHLYAINKDGTAHDASHGCKLNNTISKFLNTVGYTVPANNLIESLNPSIHMREAIFYRQFFESPDDIEVVNTEYLEHIEILNG
jgi:hypothetical protein